MQPDTHEACKNKVIDFLVRGMKGENVTSGGDAGNEESKADC